VSSTSIPEWARAYFERGYAQRWGLSPVTERIQRETDAIWARCGLNPGARVADLGCGHGRHALALAARGAQVVGVDTAVALLDRARQLGEGHSVHVRWVRADMRRVPLQSARLDLAIVIDAFGFFDSEHDNDAVLREAARVLRPGGSLVVKIVNGSPIVAAFRSGQLEERDGVVVEVTRTLSLAPARMIERLSISGARGSGQYERRQRLYRADEMAAALQAAGFAAVDISADAGGGAFDPATSSTMWIVANRPS
jgi:ubiquinone/menaquinone biosynthesis C-methylase UbiE